MWRLSMFLLCLVAALSGTPLRQAEAASDFARAIEADQLESPDGGVGDDSGVCIQRASQASTIVNLTPHVELSLSLSAPPIMSARLHQVAGTRRQRMSWPLDPSNRRHAWLQIFLF